MKKIIDLKFIGFVALWCLAIFILASCATKRVERIIDGAVVGAAKGVLGVEDDTYREEIYNEKRDIKEIKCYTVVEEESSNIFWTKEVGYEYCPNMPPRKLTEAEMNEVGG